MVAVAKNSILGFNSNSRVFNSNSIFNSTNSNSNSRIGIGIELQFQFQNWTDPNPATCPHNTSHIPSCYNNEQTTKQTKAINNSYIHISCECDTNRAGHFTLDAHASRPVACCLHTAKFVMVRYDVFELKIVLLCKCMRYTRACVYACPCIIWKYVNLCTASKTLVGVACICVCTMSILMRSVLCSALSL